MPDKVRPESPGSATGARPVANRSAIAIVASAAVLACAALLLWSSRSQDRRDRPDPSAAVAALDEEVQRLRGELRAVKANTTFVAAQKPPLAGASAEADVAARPKQPLSTEEIKERRRAVLTAWYGTIDTHFANESVDQSWGPEAARGLESLVTTNADFGNLQSARCARTMCKIVVTHADGDKQRQFAAQMSEESQLDTEVAYKYDVEANPPTTTMWVARAGHKIPRASKQ